MAQGLSLSAMRRGIRAQTRFVFLAILLALLPASTISAVAAAPCAQSDCDDAPAHKAPCDAQLAICTAGCILGCGALAAEAPASPAPLAPALRLLRAGGDVFDRGRDIRPDVPPPRFGLPV